MSQRLIDHSPDLKRLRDEGYAIAVRAGYLLVKDVPYVTEGREVARGTLVSTLNMAGDVTQLPDTHVVSFAGSFPCRSNGSPITTIQHSSQRTELAAGVIVDHSFSNKPANGYPDYYAKMTTYVTILESQAQVLDAAVTSKTFGVIEADPTESVFHYIDTAASRAGVAMLSEKLAAGAIAIVGLGGTGSYVLDLVAKTPVTEIHLFDGDRFLQHNAFRSPGAPSVETLLTAPHKVTYFKGEYERMRRGIVAHPYFIDECTLEQLRGMHFVFICIDEGPAKKRIIDHVTVWGTPFVDVGMGLQLTDGALGGIVRVTASTDGHRDHVSRRVSVADPGANAEYSQNIQIADLNALNAAMAVIKWKKLTGFYRDLEREHHSTYSLDVNMLLSEDQG